MHERRITYVYLGRSLLWSLHWWQPLFGFGGIVFSSGRYREAPLFLFLIVFVVMLVLA